jgi:dihydrodipicolinate synthase/N-acetylneuraminate lyase
VKLDVQGELAQSDRLIIDAGGDGEGAKALGRFAPFIEEIGYDMIYVINRNRYINDALEQTLHMKGVIESACGLNTTMLFNNTHLGSETTPETIAESAPFAQKIARITGLPLAELPVPVKVYVRPAWQL